MTLSIAYHNTGAECEHLKNFPEAVDHYWNGYKLCLKNFGKADPMTANLNNCYKSASKKLNISNKHTIMFSSSWWEHKGDTVSQLSKFTDGSKTPEFKNYHPDDENNIVEGSKSEEQKWYFNGKNWKKWALQWTLKIAKNKKSS